MMTPGTGHSAPERHAAFVDDLATLHRRTVDALAGYEKMVEKAEPEFRPVAQRFRDLHGQHARRLAAQLSALDAPVDADGSFMGAVNRTVVSLRAFFDEIDSDVMDNIRSGEHHVLKAFDSALASGPAEPYLGDLTAMRSELEDLLDATRHLD